MEGNEPVTEDELIDAIRAKIADAGHRIDMKTISTPPVYSAACSAAIMHTEQELGFRLTPLLRRLYMEIANGGFGPGAGLIGVEGGYTDADGRGLGQLYNAFRADGWPEWLLPLWDWGDGAWSCVDTHAQDERIIVMDEVGPTRTRFVLQTWLEAWVAGVDLLREVFHVEDAVIMNPFTRKPMSVKRRGRAIKG